MQVLDLRDFKSRERKNTAGQVNLEGHSQILKLKELQNLVRADDLCKVTDPNPIYK